MGRSRVRGPRELLPLSRCSTGSRRRRTAPTRGGEDAVAPAVGVADLWRFENRRFHPLGPGPRTGPGASAAPLGCAGLCSPVSWRWPGPPRRRRRLGKPWPPRECAHGSSVHGGSSRRLMHIGRPPRDYPSRLALRKHVDYPRPSPPTSPTPANRVERVQFLPEPQGRGNAVRRRRALRADQNG